MSKKNRFETLKKKTGLIHQFFWSLPIFSFLILTIVYTLFDLPDIQWSHLCLFAILTFSPALIYDRYIRGLKPTNSPVDTNRLPETLNIKYDLLVSKIISLFLSVNILLLISLSIILHFKEYVGLSRLLLLFILFFAFPFFRHIKRLRNPFLISFSSTKIINECKETYIWDDITQGVFYDDVLVLEVQNIDTFDRIVIFYHEVNHLDFYRAKAYIMKYTKQGMIKINPSRHKSSALFHRD